MSTVDVPVAAGSVATAVFAVSTLPMLVKAYKTKDVGSYSLGNIVLGNVGNVFYTVYVLHLPAGPIWALHLFHTVSTALMLFWYVRYVLVSAVRARRAARAARRPGRRPGRQAGRRGGSSAERASRALPDDLGTVVLQVPYRRAAAVR